jgi:hypothetical protein
LRNPYIEASHIDQGVCGIQNMAIQATTTPAAAVTPQETLQNAYKVAKSQIKTALNKKRDAQLKANPNMTVILA